MASVLVIGSSNTDLVIRTNKLPAPGETVLGGTFFTAAGGKGANQAVAAARAGALSPSAKQVLNPRFPQEIKSMRCWRIFLDDIPALSYISIPFPRLPPPLSLMPSRIRKEI